MARHRTRRSIPVALALTLAALGAWMGPGCSTVSGASVCDQWCECEGCSKTEREECEASFATGQKLTTDQGCPDLFDSFLGCLADHLQCVGDEVDTDACETERKAMNKCTGGPCQKLLDAQSSCCEQITDAGTRQLCMDNVEQIDVESLSDSVCEAVLPSLVCSTG